MTDSALLKDKINEKGLKLGFIIEKLDTSYGWFKKKLNNEKNFTVKEMQILCEILGITDLAERDRIFFAKNVEKSST